MPVRTSLRRSFDRVRDASLLVLPPVSRSLPLRRVDPGTFRYRKYVSLTTCALVSFLGTLTPEFSVELTTKLLSGVLRQTRPSSLPLLSPSSWGRPLLPITVPRVASLPFKLNLTQSFHLGRPRGHSTGSPRYLDGSGLHAMHHTSCSIHSKSRAHPETSTTRTYETIQCTR